MSGRLWWSVGGGVLFVPVVGLACLHTPVGRSAMRWAAEAGAATVLQGRLHIGAVEGSPFGTLRLRNVKLVDRQGVAAAEAEVLQVQHRVGALLRGQIHVTDAEIKSLKLDVPRLIDALPGRNGDDGRPSEPIIVRVDRAELDATHIILGTEMTAHRVQVVASATVAGSLMYATITELTGHVLGQRFRVRGDVEWNGDRMTDLEVRAEYGRVTLDLDTVATATDAVAVDGRLRWPAGALMSLWPETRLLGAADLGLRLRGDLAKFVVGMDGRLAGAQLDVEARGPTLPLTVNINAKGIDPRRIDARAPKGAFGVTIAAWGALTRTPAGLQPEGRIRIRGRGRLAGTEDRRPIVVERLRARARLGPDGLSTGLRIDSSAGRIRATARSQWGDGQPRLAHATAHVHRLALGDLSRGAVAGTLTATVHAAGPIEAPRATARIETNDLAFATTQIRRLKTEWRWRPQARRYRARVEGRVRGLRRGAIDIEAASFVAHTDDANETMLTATATGAQGPIRGIDLTAQLNRTSTTTRLRWTHLTWRSPRTTWRVRPGRLLHRKDRLSVPEFEAWSESGVVRGSVDIDPRTPLGPRSRVKLHVDHLDLATLTGVAPQLSTAPVGELSARVEVDGRRSAIGVRADVARMRWRPGWPAVSGHTAFTANATDARWVADLAGPEWGNVSLDSRFHRPAEAHSFADWAQPSLSDLRSGSMRFDLNLADWPDDVVPVGLGGQVSGRIDLGAGLESMSAKLDASTLTAADLPVFKTVSLTAKGTSRSIEARARAEIGSHRASTIVARLRHGLPELIRGIPRADLRGQFRADVDGFPVELLRLRVEPDAAKPVSGRLTVRARGGHSEHGPILVGFIRGRDLRIIDGAPALDLAAQGHLNRRVTTATATLTAPELGRHRASIRLRTPDLENRPYDLAALIPHLQSVAVRSDNVRLSFLRALGFEAPSLRGRLNARLRAGPGLRRLTAAVSARHVQLSRAVAPLDLQVLLTDQDDGVGISARSVLGGAPFLSMVGRMPIGLRPLLAARDPARIPIRAEITSARFPLARAMIDSADRRQVEGRLVVTASVGGTLADPRVRSRITVDQLALGPTRFRRFEVTHTADPGGRTTSARFEQHGGGMLHATLTADPDWVGGSVQARRFRLGFISALANLTDAGAAIDGTLDGHATLDGTALAPQLAGALRLTGMRVAIPDLPPIDGGELDLSVAQQAITLGFDARSGPGRIAAQLRGQVPSLSETRLSGSFEIDDVPIVAAGRVLGVQLAGELGAFRSAAGLDAEVVLRRGRVRLPDASARARHPLPNQKDVVFRHGQWRPIVGPKAADVRPPRFTVRIRSTNPLEVRGQPIRATVGVDLVAKGRRSGTALTGNIRVQDGGLTLFGRRYTVERASMILSGRTPTDPRLDVRLSHKFSACTFFVSLVGTTSEPKIVLSAQPDIYDDRQLFAFLFGASPEGERYERTPAQQGLDLAAWLLLEEVRSRLKRALPFDTLAVDLGAGTDSGQANVTLGKWLTDQLFLAYAYHHGAARDENTSEGLLRYRFLGSWLLEMVFGDRGNGGADVFWTRRW